MLVYCAGNFAAVRSPDSEIQFRTAEALAFRGGAAIDKDLAAWPGFGVAKGLDGQRYSVFGPLQPLLLWPFLSLAEPLANTLAADTRFPLPASHYVGNFDDSIASRIQGDRLPHARRFIVSFLNPALGALAVSMFFLSAFLLVGALRSALYATACFAFASPLWAYAGTYFSETLALAALLTSFSCLLGSRKAETKKFQGLLLLGAGLLFGAASVAHISALLWFPFFLLLVHRETNSLRSCLNRHFANAICLFVLGFAGPMFFLAQFNLERFGSIFETGRYVNAEAAKAFGYGYFILPVESLFGLLFSAGKGMFVFAPITLLAIVCGRNFLRAAPWVFRVLMCGAVFRILIIATRSDWHGGFALGPRYLLLVLPFLILPLAYTWAEAKRRTLLVAAMALCILEQAYVCCGEVFSYYHAIVVAADRQGVDVFSADRLYFDWAYSPLLGFVGTPAAPFLARLLGVGFLPYVILLFALATLSLWSWFKAVNNIK